MYCLLNIPGVESITDVTVSSLEGTWLAGSISVSKNEMNKKILISMDQFPLHAYYDNCLGLKPPSSAWIFFEALGYE